MGKGGKEEAASGKRRAELAPRALLLRSSGTLATIHCLLRFRRTGGLCFEYGASLSGGY